MKRRVTTAAPGQPWCTGWAEYWIEREVSEHLYVVAVRCRIPGLDNVEFALLDTGAQWTLIGGELAEMVRPFAGAMGQSIRYATRYGVLDAETVRLGVVLVADEGTDLAVDATVVLAPEWPGPPIVLGYRGLLETRWNC